MKKINIIALPLIMMTIGTSVITTSNVRASSSYGNIVKSKITMDKYVAGKSVIYGDLFGKDIADVYVAKNDEIIYSSKGTIRDDNSYRISMSKDLVNKISKNMSSYKVVAVNVHKKIISSVSFAKEVSTGFVNNIKYNANDGILTGEVSKDITSIQVNIDGNKFDEKFILENGKFESRVSNDFWHEAKFGNHNITITALNDLGNVVANGSLELN